jgi:hypothetical protein
VNRIKIVKDSDWQTYFGSNKKLHEDLDKFGRENFTREIIRLCKTLGEGNYWELWFQMNDHVLYHPDKFYNSYIGTRVSRTQLNIKE